MNAGIDNIHQEILIMRNPRTERRVFGIGPIQVPNSESSRFPHPPESSHHSGRMVFMVTNRMRQICRRDKLANRPSVAVVNIAVGIPDQHKVYFGFINGKEAFNHIFGPKNARWFENNVWIRRHCIHHELRDVRCHVDIDLPRWELCLDQLNVGQHWRVVPRILRPIETVGEHIYHSLLSKKYDFRKIIF